LSLDYGAGGVNVGLSTTMFTDSNGNIGVTTPTVTYFVSSHAGDAARIWMGTVTAPSNIAPFIATQKNISGNLTTTGGSPSQLVFLSTPSSALVGINELPGAGGNYTIEALDDFNNITTQGFASPLLLQIPTAETTVHQNKGYTLGLFGAGGDFGFRDSSNSQFITSVLISAGASQASFRYHDRMSSYSGPGPSSNTYAAGRPGTWTIQIYNGTALLAQHSLRMDPDVPRQINFANPQNSEVVGRTLDYANNLASFQAELQDGFTNPSVATQTVTVTLTTTTRMASRVNDYAGFSVSSSALLGSRVSAPGFFAPTSTLTIAIGQYQTTFYYLDTTASNLYASGGGTKPIISLSVDSLFGNSQSVTQLSDTIDRIVISTGAGAVLQAGTTSQIFTYETRDIFGNPSPLRSGQDFGLGYVQMRLTTDDTASVQFSTPDVGNFVSGSAVSYLPVGYSATSFYMIDTLLTPAGSTHTLTVAGITYPSWLTATSSYTVNPGPPAQIGWATPARRLVAGTTIQYELGVPTTTVVAAQLLDQFGNVTTSTTTFFINYTAPGQNSTFGGINSNAVIVATAPSSLWTNIGTQNLTVNIPGNAGLSQAPMYFWSTVAGGATIYAQAQVSGSNIFTPITQVHQVTPGAAAYLTLHHPYTANNPLKVGVPGTISIKARDLFGNVATGDPQNGNYFTDVVGFNSSGSTASVTLIDLTNGASYHVFVATDAGVFPNLGVVDTYQEVLQVSATDFTRPSVWGITNDTSRVGLPASASLRSDGNLEFAGIVITPADLAPESNPPPTA
jgi:hypothetical protein